MSVLVASAVRELEHATSAIDTALAVALALDDHARTGAEIVRTTRRPRSAVYRHLDALVGARLAEKVDGGYVRATSTDSDAEQAHQNGRPHPHPVTTSTSRSRRIARLADRTAGLPRAAGCSCERPIRSTDQDGDAVCASCGRALGVAA